MGDICKILIQNGCRFITHSTTISSPVYEIVLLFCLCYVQKIQILFSFSFAFLWCNSHTKSDLFNTRCNFKSTNKSLCIHIMPSFGISKSDQIGLYGMYIITYFQYFCHLNTLSSTKVLVSSFKNHFLCYMDSDK